MRELFGRPDFRRLFVGQAVSGFGDWMVTIALMVLVLQVSGSSTAVGGILLMRLLPAAVAGPVATRLAQRWSRRRTMLIADLARAGIVVTIPLAHTLWWIYLWAFLLETVGVIFLPARDSLIPELVDGERLPMANGLVLGSSYGTIPFGAAAFAAVSALSPTGRGFIAGHPFLLVFVVDAVTFLVSFGFVLRITAGREPAGSAPGEQSAGFIDALRLPLVRSVMVPTAAIALALGALFSLGVVYVRDALGASDTQFGFLIALFGAGAAVGLGSAQALRSVDSLVKIQVGVVAQGATVALMSLANGLIMAFVGALAFGAATAFVLAVGMSTLQETLADGDRVLAFTAFHVVTRVALSLSAMLAGAVGDVVGTVAVPVFGALQPSRLVLLCSGGLVLISAVILRTRTDGRTAAELARC